MYTKICGLKSEKDITYVNELKPDYIGFVFAEGRKKTIEVDDALELKSLLDRDIKAVGVFVNQSIDYISSLYDSGIIDVAQLHGDEDEDFILELKERCDIPIIKAFVLNDNTDYDIINNNSADIILVDSGQGSGVRLEDNKLLDINRDYFLAGGLSPENVKNALEDADKHLIGLDVSSGVETDGAKDYEKIKAFLNTIRG